MFPRPVPHGGVIANGGIRRDVTFSLAASSVARAGDDDEANARPSPLHPWAVAGRAHRAAADVSRQGCNLVPDIDNPRKVTLVNADGTRENLSLRTTGARFREAAAKEFGVGESQT